MLVMGCEQLSALARSKRQRGNGFNPRRWSGRTQSRSGCSSPALLSIRIPVVSKTREEPTARRFVHAQTGLGLARCGGPQKCLFLVTLAGSAPSRGAQTAATLHGLPLPHSTLRQAQISCGPLVPIGQKVSSHLLGPTRPNPHIDVRLLTNQSMGSQTDFP